MGQTPWALSQVARTRGAGWYMGVERLLRQRLATLRLKIFLDRATDGTKSDEAEPLGAQDDAEEIVSLAELKELLQSKAITEKTMCWMQGFPDWCPIYSCREQLGLLDNGSIVEMGAAAASAVASTDTKSSHQARVMRQVSQRIPTDGDEPASLQSWVGLTSEQRVPPFCVAVALQQTPGLYVVYHRHT